MRLVKYCLYLAIKGQRYRIGLTDDIRFLAAYLYEIKGHDSFIQLSSPLRFIDSYFVFEKLQSKWDCQGVFPGHLNFLSTLSKIIVKVSRRIGLNKKDINSLSNSINVIRRDHCVGMNMEFPCDNELDAVYDLIKGRMLFLHEVGSIISSRLPHMGEGDKVLPMLNILSFSNKTYSLPSVRRIGWHDVKCNRCEEGDNISRVQCAICGDTDYMCNECLNMGISTGCGSLFATEPQNVYRIKTERKRQSIKINFDFTFSKAQKKASLHLKAYVQNSFQGHSVYGEVEKDREKKELLVWAVCGAGKTEVTFCAIQEMLSRGGKVLFAIPRRDVVVDLGPRIKRAFPESSTSMLFGGSHQKFVDSDITIATTHQALRLYKMFGLVILDEVDAYPYRGSRMLPRIMRRAAADGGMYIYMTATPGKEMERQVRKGDLEVIKIPARYHGHPLPVPEIVKTRLGKGKNKSSLPKKIVKDIYKTVIIDGLQCFLFVPTVQLCERIGNALKNHFAEDFCIDYSHSRDENRGHKVDQFLTGYIRLLVTTSILERGVTVPRCNVIVLFADNSQIFDTGALIQMAGRAGRRKEYPRGRIWFVSEKITPAMKRAIKIIKEMNKEAAHMGYLS